MLVTHLWMVGAFLGTPISKRVIGNGAMPKAFVVLEGGGAKGVAHIGALRALEESDYEIIGIAGSSAGALVATLYALGLSSKEIIDEGIRHHVLKDLQPPLENATKILGKRWFLIALSRWLFSTWGRRIARVCALSVLLTWGLLILFVLGFNVAPVDLLLIPLIVFGTFVCGLVWLALDGFTRLDKLADYIGKLGEEKVGNKPRFRDFAPTNGSCRPILKMVATDVTNGTMELFSPDKTPDVLIEEAVAASICIPIMFRSRKITEGLPGRETHHFHDGGLVSNLPAWVFDDDRAVHGWPLTVVVEIEDTKDLDRIRSSLQWLMQTVRATIFGSKELNVRGVEPVVRVRLPVPDKELALADFDAGWDTLRSVIEKGRRSTEMALVLEEGRRHAITDLYQRCRGILAQPTQQGSGRRRIGNLRVTMAMLQPWEVDKVQSGEPHNVVLRFAYWSRIRADRYPLMPTKLHGTIAEEAITKQRVLFGDFSQGVNASGNKGAPVSTLHRKAKWNLCFPLYLVESDDRRYHLFIMIEGDTRLAGLPEEVLASRLRAVYSIVDQRMTSLIEAEGQAA